MTQQELHKILTQGESTHIEFKEDTGGATPYFIEDEPFLSVIPMVVYKIGGFYHLYLSLSQLTEDELGTERINQLQDLPLDLSLKDLTEKEELILKLVGSWQEKSEELENFRFLINSDIEIYELKKVGSSGEKSGEFLKRRGRVLLGTLLLSLVPISLEELASVLGYRSKERYRDDYVKPLKDNGLITYTLEQANDPDQQYKITQRGINFLVGSAV